MHVRRVSRSVFFHPNTGGGILDQDVIHNYTWLRGGGGILDQIHGGYS